VPIYGKLTDKPLSQAVTNITGQALALQNQLQTARSYVSLQRRHTYEEIGSAIFQKNPQSEKISPEQLEEFRNSIRDIFNSPFQNLATF
jgi:hypothetical protein